MSSSPDPNAAIANLLATAISDGVCSAAAAAVGDRDRGWTWIHGHTAAHPTLGPPIDAATRFDLASLTKPIATAAIAMVLVGDRTLDLEASASRWLPIAPAVTVAHLLGHAAGFPAHHALYQRIWAGDLAGTSDARAALVAMACATPLVSAPGIAAVYSDLGYIALGALLERVTDRELPELLPILTEPLGMAATGYVDLREPRASSSLSGSVVATEIDARRGLVVGEVHDENCHAGGGVAGHAGLFAPIGDVARFAAAMSRAPRVAVGRFQPEVVERFFTRSAAPDTSWRLGWDTPSSIAGISHAGDNWPRHHAVGHLGFTGTSMWLDWARGRWAVLLTNRVHPTRDRPEATMIKDLRRRFGDLSWGQDP